jgi:hypothetical protein
MLVASMTLLRLRLNATAPKWRALMKIAELSSHANFGTYSR